MDTSFVSITGSEAVSRLRKSLAHLDQDLFPVLDPDTDEMVGVLSKSDLVDPPRTRLALVDHNEFAQAVTGVEESEIVEVHRPPPPRRRPRLARADPLPQRTRWLHFTLVARKFPPSLPGA